MPTQPRGRVIDARSRWTDDRIDDLADRVFGNTNVIEALSRMPAEVRDLLLQNNREMHSELETHRREMRAEFDGHRRERQAEFKAHELKLEKKLDEVEPLGAWGTTRAVFLAISPWATVITALIAAK